MIKNLKYYLNLFIFSLVLLLLCSTFVILLSTSAHAQTENPQVQRISKAITLQAPLPIEGGEYIENSNKSYLFTYMVKLYRFVLGIAGIAAIVELILAGFQIALSADDTSGVENGKKRVIQTLEGISILVCSAIVLNTINPVAFNFDEEVKILEYTDYQTTLEDVNMNIVNANSVNQTYASNSGQKFTPAGTVSTFTGTPEQQQMVTQGMAEFAKRYPEKPPQGSIIKPCQNYKFYFASNETPGTKINHLSMEEIKSTYEIVKGNMRVKDGVVSGFVPKSYLSKIEGTDPDYWMKGYDALYLAPSAYNSLVNDIGKEFPDYKKHLVNTYRDFAGQVFAKKRYCSGQAHTPGQSNHGFGLAIDLRDYGKLKPLMQTKGWTGIRGDNERHHVEYLYAANYKGQPQKTTTPTAKNTSSLVGASNKKNNKTTTTTTPKTTTTTTSGNWTNLKDGKIAYMMNQGQDMLVAIGGWGPTNIKLQTIKPWAKALNDKRKEVTGKNFAYTYAVQIGAINGFGAPNGTIAKQLADDILTKNPSGKIIITSHSSGGYVACPLITALINGTINKKNIYYANIDGVNCNGAGNTKTWIGKTPWIKENSNGNKIEEINKNTDACNNYNWCSHFTVIRHGLQGGDTDTAYKTTTVSNVTWSYLKGWWGI